MTGEVGYWRQSSFNDLARKGSPIITIGANVQPCREAFESWAVLRVGLLRQVREARNLDIVVDVNMFAAFCSPSIFKSNAEARTGCFGDVLEYNWSGRVR